MFNEIKVAAEWNFALEEESIDALHSFQKIYSWITWFLFFRMVSRNRRLEPMLILNDESLTTNGEDGRIHDFA